jgi:hypothetical protein
MLLHIVDDSESCSRFMCAPGGGSPAPSALTPPSSEMPRNPAFDVASCIRILCADHLCRNNHGPVCQSRAQEFGCMRGTRSRRRARAHGSEKHYRCKPSYKEAGGGRQTRRHILDNEDSGTRVACAELVT